MKPFQIIHVIYAIAMFGIFLTILLLEVFVVLSPRLNRWISAVILLILSIVGLFAISIKKVQKWIPIFARGYKHGFTMTVAGGLAIAENLEEARSILAFVVIGLSFIFTILSIFLDRRTDKVEGSDDLNTTNPNVDDFKVSRASAKDPALNFPN